MVLCFSSSLSLLLLLLWWWYLWLWSTAKCATYDQMAKTCSFLDSIWQRPGGTPQKKIIMENFQCSKHLNCWVTKHIIRKDDVKFYNMKWMSTMHQHFYQIFHQLVKEKINWKRNYENIINTNWGGWRDSMAKNLIEKISSCPG